MKYKNSLLLLLIALSGSAQAISFLDYYHDYYQDKSVFKKLGIPSHKEEVDEEVAAGELHLYNKDLTDLVGFNEIPGLIALRVLNLGDNQLTTVPANIFNGLNLEAVYLENNPIPLTHAQLRKKLQLPRNVVLGFKSLGQEQAEHDLFTAIKNSYAFRVRQRIDDMVRGLFSRINISKIRDANGDNLLHAAIKDAAKRIEVIDKELGNIRRDEELSADEKKTATSVLLEQKREINDRYMKIMGAILSCGEECVQDMLFTPNAEGQQVIDEIVAKLGFNSPTYKAIFEGLSSEEEVLHPRPKRALEQAASEAAKPVETMVDVEAIEKEQEEEAEDRKRQKPNQPEE